MSTQTIINFHPANVKEKRSNNESKLEFNFYHSKHVRLRLLSAELCYVQKLGTQPSASPSEHSYGLEELSPKYSSFFSTHFQWRFHILSFCNPWPQAANLFLKLAHSFPCPTPCLHIFFGRDPRYREILCQTQVQSEDTSQFPKKNNVSTEESITCEELHLYKSKDACKWLVTVISLSN